MRTESTEPRSRNAVIHRLEVIESNRKFQLGPQRSDSVLPERVQPHRIELSSSSSAPSSRQAQGLIVIACCLMLLFSMWNTYWWYTQLAAPVTAWIGLLECSSSDGCGSAESPKPITEPQSPAPIIAQPALLPSYQQMADSWRADISAQAAAIERAAAMYRFDADLLATIVDAESDGIPYRVSSAGAVGLMGIMPVEAGVGFSDRPATYELVDPALNSEWGAKILASYIDDADGDVLMALAAYAGGWGNAHLYEPQAYAGAILADFAYRVAVRTGVADAENRLWWLETKILYGVDSAESDKPPAIPVGNLDLPDAIGTHILHVGTTDSGVSYAIIGYAVEQ